MIAFGSQGMGKLVYQHEEEYHDPEKEIRGTKQHKNQKKEDKGPMEFYVYPE
jgi:hypothetical protein